MTAALLAALRAQPEYEDARMMGAPDGDALAIARDAAQARHRVRPTLDSCFPGEPG